MEKTEAIEFNVRRKRPSLHEWKVVRGDSRIESLRHAGFVYRQHARDRNDFVRPGFESLRRTCTVYYQLEDDWNEIVLRPRVVRPFKSLEMKFQTLAQEWKRESRFASAPNQMFLLPSYQKIIGLGPEAIPIILRELRGEPNHWFWALAAMSEENPVEPQNAGNVQAMRQAWLDWGTQRGLL